MEEANEKAGNRNVGYVRFPLLALKCTKIGYLWMVSSQSNHKGNQKGEFGRFKT